MSKIIAICNQKGGCGKTTSAVSLGAGLVKGGKKVLLIDADAQGDLTKSIWRDRESGDAVEPDTVDYTLASALSQVINEEDVDTGKGIISHWEGYDFIPGNVDLSGLEMTLVSVTFRETILKQYVDMLRDRYDYIIIDCMVDANLHREKLLPGEKAKAYKMKMDALRRKAGRPVKENPRQLVGNYESADIVGKETGESGRQIQRYIRLTELLPELLSMVDENTIKFGIGVELSYLSGEEQQNLLNIMQGIYSDYAED